MTVFIAIVVAVLPVLIGGAFWLDPLFIVAAPVFVAMLAIDISMRSGVRPGHRFAIVWLAFAAAAALAGLRAQERASFEYPQALAIALMIGAALVSMRHLLVVAGASLVLISALLSVTGAAPMQILDAYLVTVALTFTAVMMAVYLEHERARRREARRALAEGQQELRDLLDSTKELMLAVDEAGYLRVVNRAASAWASRALGREMAAGERLFDLVPGYLRAAYVRHASQALGGDHCIWRFEHAGNTYELAFFPLRGEVRGFVVCGRDVTDALPGRDQVAAAETRTKREVLNMVNHEISTPLTPILLTTGRLLRSGQDADLEAYKRAMQLVERNVERVVNAVSEMVAQGTRVPDEDKAAAMMARDDEVLGE